MSIRLLSRGLGDCFEQSKELEKFSSGGQNG
jgi:hypothetical protein